MNYRLLLHLTILLFSGSCLLSSVSESLLLLIRQVREAIQEVIPTVDFPCINPPVLHDRQRPVHTHQPNAHAIADNHCCEPSRIGRA